MHFIKEGKGFKFRKEEKEKRVGYFWICSCSGETFEQEDAVMQERRMHKKKLRTGTRLENKV